MKTFLIPLTIVLVTLVCFTIAFMLYARYQRAEHKKKICELLKRLDENLKNNEQIISLEKNSNILVLHQKVRMQEAFRIILTELGELGFVLQDKYLDVHGISMFIIENKDREEYYCRITWEKYRCSLEIT